jgi:hypothetical protein
MTASATTPLPVPAPEVRGPLQRRASGFSLVETVVASALLLFVFLGLTGAFVVGFARINGSGNNTVGLAAARQILEEMRRLPYADMVNLNGFNTDDANTLPGTEPEREVARRWRYAVAGGGVGWTFTQDETTRWTTFANQGDSLEARGTIQVVNINANLSEVRVSVIVPGTWRQVQLSTRIASLP